MRSRYPVSRPAEPGKPDSPAIHIQSLNKAYPGVNGARPLALDNLCLSVPAGQVVALLGPAGSGKSTLLGVVRGSISPSDGRLRLFGHDPAVGECHSSDYVSLLEHTRCGADLQRSVWNTLCPEGSLLGAHRERPENPAAARELLAAIGLWERRGEPVSNLSHFEQQRVGIAGALSSSRPIVLFDAPAENVIQKTPVLKAEMQLQRRSGDKTFVLVTEDVPLGSDLCDRLVVLSNGRVASDQPLRKISTLRSGGYYRVRVLGHLEPRRATWFDGLTVTSDGDDTVLSGDIPDQAALHGVLMRIRDLGLPILSVQALQTGIEDKILMEATDSSDSPSLPLH